MRVFRNQAHSTNTLLASAAAITLLVLFDQSKPAPQTPFGAKLQARDTSTRDRERHGWAEPTISTTPARRSNLNHHLQVNPETAPAAVQPLRPVPVDQSLFVSPGYLAVQPPGRQAPAGVQF